MKPFPNIFLNFEEAYTVGNQLWDFGKLLQDDLRYAKPPNWVLTYRYAIRAMMARILTVDRDYRKLNEPGCGLAPIYESATPKDRNEWNVIWESYARVLFFAMDSSLECFTYALNALGYLLFPSDFIDITNDKKLRQISPSKLFAPPKEKGHPAYYAFQKLFPRICANWSANCDLIAKIVEYHDATKHRHSAVVGQGPECHFLKPEPKQAMGEIVFNFGLVPHVNEESLQSITASYRNFLVAWLKIARQELEIVFEQPLPAPH